MPTVETTEKSTIRAPQPPTTAPMMKRVSASVAETGPVAVAARVANEPISAVPSSTVTNVASEAVARCRSEAKARPVMTPLLHVTSSSRWAICPATASAVGRSIRPAIRPSTRKTTVSAYDAATGSWVTMTTVWPQVVDAGPQQGQHLARGRGVEGAGRLVGEDDRGVGDQRPGDRDPLLLAAGERAGAAARRGRRARPARAAPRTRARSDAVAGQPERQPDVLLGGQVGHQVEALEDEADPLAAEPGAVLLAQSRDVLAGDEDPALGRPVQTGGAGEERRLAGPGRAPSPR